MLEVDVASVQLKDGSLLMEQRTSFYKFIYLTDSNALLVRFIEMIRFKCEVEIFKPIRQSCLPYWTVLDGVWLQE